ncbi:hypothetical protein ACSYAY_08395 [Leptospirillum ferriphilum]|uniref:Uncharacterized protein n=2 Tax=Leptospirillum TaxID=179 RepID=A0A094X4S0_9BACT|nr:hypothetical protein [Leptospirillum ferriphilum]EDZ38902.1 MAG: Protein of unknown function [Leptospirillum sp. Group II '5-way CG']KGA93539.1 hypothetical protein LptCag_0152 [Leptospirillum ferriphilum]
MTASARSERSFLQDLPPLPPGQGDFFDPSPLFRVFLIDGGEPCLPGVLSWVDMWYSGLISRALSSFSRSGKPFPDSLLFVPESPPLQRGFLIVRRPSLGKDPVNGLIGLLTGMGVEKAVLDGTLLTGEALPEPVDPERLPVDAGGRSILFLSDPVGLPASCILRGK